MQEFRLPESTEEYTVTIAASVAQYFLRRDRAVGMLAYGQSNESSSPTGASGSSTAFWRRWPCCAPRGRAAVGHALRRVPSLPARHDDDRGHAPSPAKNGRWPPGNCRGRGLRVVTILVNPASFYGRARPSRSISLLRGGGQVAYLVNNGDDLTGAQPRGDQAGYFAV
jgi:hypothetical protein